MRTFGVRSLRNTFHGLGIIIFLEQPCASFVICKALCYNAKEAVPVGADGVHRSAVLSGFWLRVDWLWQAQPDVLRAVAEIIGPDQVAEALRQAIKRP